MSFQLPANITLQHEKAIDPCHKYALDELVRLFGRLGCGNVSLSELPESDNYYFVISTGKTDAKPVDVSDVLHDGFVIDVESKKIILSATSAKGLLNAVYKLAEAFGIIFLVPGENGEWIPETPQPLSIGRVYLNPRFPHRGVFWQPLNTKDFTHEEWLRFYGKLKFNVVSDYNKDSKTLEEVGLRFETGGHGLRELLPREEFDNTPDLFRMFQPEDFGGKRQPDSNLCITNPETRRVITNNFKKRLSELGDCYGLNAWADDLPSGGWCMCPSCRSFNAADQSQMAMNLLAATAAEEGKTKIAILAYHDTMMPGTEVTPHQNCYLLFAPRERCYGHAIDDPDCERNRFYFQTLKAWQQKCQNISDNHTFEYYFDQILFRGLFPFLPEIIIRDMDVYEAHNIESHMSLQVAGPVIAPEYNMLVFANAQWDKSLTAGSFINKIIKKFNTDSAEALGQYLNSRSKIFTEAMRICGHNHDMYLDYRWLPESTTDFANEMAECYANASIELSRSADFLESAIIKEQSDNFKNLLQKEINRARFEAAELDVMHMQQKASWHLARYLTRNDSVEASTACEWFEKAIKASEIAYEKGLKYGMDEESTWYFRTVNKWLRREFETKAKMYMDSTVKT